MQEILSEYEICVFNNNIVRINNKDFPTQFTSIHKKCLSVKLSCLQKGMHKWAKGK